MILKLVWIVLALLIGVVVWTALKKPSNDRVWSLDQALLPTAEFDGDVVTVRNIRNFTYTSTTDYTPAYYDKTFDLNKLVAAWYVVEPFSPVTGPAHTFLSFEFEGDQFLAISIEIRKEVGERFQFVRSTMNNYELMYVIADERDAIKLRSNFRKDKVYLYPVKATAEELRPVFVDMLNTANRLASKPEFYNLFTNSCTTKIVDHINAQGSRQVPFSWKCILPAYSDALALELGFLDTDLSIEAARERYLINPLAEAHADDPDFSLRIRGR